MKTLLTLFGFLLYPSRAQNLKLQCSSKKKRSWKFAIVTFICIKYVNETNSLVRLACKIHNINTNSPFAVLDKGNPFLPESVCRQCLCITIIFFVKSSLIHLFSKTYNVDLSSVFKSYYNGKLESLHNMHVHVCLPSSYVVVHHKHSFILQIKFIIRRRI